MPGRPLGENRRRTACYARSAGRAGRRRAGRRRRSGCAVGRMFGRPWISAHLYRAVTRGQGTFWIIAVGKPAREAPRCRGLAGASYLGCRGGKSLYPVARRRRTPGKSGAVSSHLGQYVGRHPLGGSGSSDRFHERRLPETQSATWPDNRHYWEGPLHGLSFFGGERARGVSASPRNRHAAGHGRANRYRGTGNCYRNAKVPGLRARPSLPYPHGGAGYHGAQTFRRGITGKRRKIPDARRDVPARPDHLSRRQSRFRQ